MSLLLLSLTPTTTPPLWHSQNALRGNGWIKKGRKSMLGYKGFARCDEEGFVDKIHTTPANVGESPQFGTMIDGTKAQRVLADKAYLCSKMPSLHPLGGAKAMLFV